MNQSNPLSKLHCHPDEYNMLNKLHNLEKARKTHKYSQLICFAMEEN